MWYVVHLLFAGDPDSAGNAVLCESSQVLFDALNARAACDRGEAWARAWEGDGQMRLLGIQWVHRLDRAPADGVEVGGSFQDIVDPWSRRDELIPPRDQLPAILWESDAPIEEWATDEQMGRLRQVMDE